MHGKAHTRTIAGSKKYKQLKFELVALREQYGAIELCFRLNTRPVCGYLQGSAADWKFESDSPAFLQQVPGGILYKYMFWPDGVPKYVGRVYDGISGAAYKAGYDLAEKEEAVSW